VHTIELVDLNQHHDAALLRRVYDELYCPTFIDPDEQETLEQYRSRLFDPLLPPPQPVTHFVVAGRNLKRGREAELLGFIIFESYRESVCGLMTYLVTVPAARGQGLGKRLVAEAQTALRRDMEAWHGRPDGLRAIFAEVHDPGRVVADRDVINPSVRLEIMRRLGAAQVPIHYVQPELYPGGQRSRQLLLTAFPLQGTVPPQVLSAMVVTAFLHEFYRALGVAHPESDADFRAMQVELDRAKHESPAASAPPLPCVRIVD